MGTNIFKKIRRWHRENRQYDGFFEMEVYGCVVLIILVGNICIRNTSVVDWLIWVIWLQTTLHQSYKWLHNRSNKQILDFAKDRMGEMIHELIDDKYAEHAHLVAANRRRKRAERALKKTRLALRKESAERLGCEVKADEYEKILLYVHILVDEESYAHQDPLAVAEAERQVKEYLRVHFSAIVVRQASRSLYEDALDCLFVGDRKADPKETYAGIFANTPLKEIKENQES